MEKNFIIITSINKITKAISKFAKMQEWQVIVIGDKKSPPIKKQPQKNVTFLSINDQKKLGYNFDKICPFNHYARKNIGYLYAINEGAKHILDTDDDNFPYDTWGKDIFPPPSAMKSISGPKFVNIYKHFTDEFIWPRGFPLELIKDKTKLKINPERKHQIAVWQGLADKDPDVDAIYRLTINKLIKFNKKPPIAIEKGVYCPFNTQNTVWTLKKSFPYLYIPISVNFRFCDILKSYIAQRGLWALNAKLAFTSASVYQERNPHDYMKDFIDEIPCYTDIKKTVELLDRLDLVGDPKKDIVKMYKNLEKIGIVKKTDIEGVKIFISDLP